MALISVDRSDEWNKAIHNPPTPGRSPYLYGWHPRNMTWYPAPTRIIIHTTNGQKGSTFEAEAAYLRDSKDVGCHYILSKAGYCIRILDPRIGCAWHAGAVLAGWSNNYSIGIEMHFTPGEPISSYQIEACGRLVLDLCAVWKLGNLVQTMERHRTVAVPAGRKIDPSNMSDAEFIRWRNDLQNQRAFYGA